MSRTKFTNRDYKKGPTRRGGLDADGAGTSLLMLNYRLANQIREALTKGVKLKPPRLTKDFTAEEIAEMTKLYSKKEK